MCDGGRHAPTSVDTKLQQKAESLADTLVMVPLSASADETRAPVCLAERMHVTLRAHGAVHGLGDPHVVCGPPFDAGPDPALLPLATLLELPMHMGGLGLFTIWRVEQGPIVPGGRMLVSPYIYRAPAFIRWWSAAAGG